MSILAVEIHDAGLQAKADAPAAGAAPAPSPGIALIDGENLLVGERAAEVARLSPRRVNNRFWCELDTAPLPRPFPDHVSHADLAHAQLTELWAQVRPGVDSVLLVVPGSSTERQLGLTLGIARATGMPVRGLVDAAVAACVGVPADGPVLHVDLQLHRAVVTELVRGGELVRRAVQLSPHAGLVALHDAWVKRIAERFVAVTRYDPLHVAASEQELYRRLPEVLAALLHDDSAGIELSAGGRSKQVIVERADLVAAADAIYEGVVQPVRLLKRAGRRATLALSHRVAGLPGLRSRLAAIGDAAIVELSATAALDGALMRSGLVIGPQDEALPFVIRLPAEPRTERPPIAVADPPPVLETGARGAPPTHLLLDGRAHPIGAEPLALGAGAPDRRGGLRLRGATAGVSRSHCTVFRDAGRVIVEDHSRYGSFLNGQRIEGRVELAVGDRLRLGSPGIELLAIVVVNGDETA